MLHTFTVICHFFWYCGFSSQSVRLMLFLKLTRHDVFLIKCSVLAPYNCVLEFLIAHRDYMLCFLFVWKTDPHLFIYLVLQVLQKNFMYPAKDACALCSNHCLQCWGHIPSQATIAFCPCPTNITDVKIKLKLKLKLFLGTLAHSHGSKQSRLCTLVLLCMKWTPVTRGQRLWSGKNNPPAWAIPELRCDLHVKQQGTNDKGHFPCLPAGLQRLYEGGWHQCVLRWTSVQNTTSKTECSLLWNWSSCPRTALRSPSHSIKPLLTVWSMPTVDG